MKKRKNRLFTVFFLFTAILLHGQELRQVPFFDASETAKQAAIARTKALVEAHFVVPTRFDKEAKAAFLQERDRMSADIASTISDEAIFDDVLWPYINGVLAKVSTANPGLSPIHIILTGNPSPNAYSVGEGTVVVFTGLISELENEDQLAFVLCHEIAHFVLDHANKRLIKDIDHFQSKAFKEQLKKIEEAEFNQSELYETMMMNTRFKSRYHHRDLERQADSLAYRLFQNTGFDADQGRRVMQLFEKMDSPGRDSSLQLNRVFGCAAAPFQEKWLEKGSSSIWGTTIAAQEEKRKSLEDSLSTHPDAKLRLKYMSEMMGKNDLPQTPPFNNDFQRLRFLSALENLNTLYGLKRYDHTIYAALLYRMEYPDCGFFQDMLALAMNGLFVNAKNHNLSEVLSDTSPYYDENYNELLTFLNNLRVGEMLALQNCLVQSRNSTESEYALFAAYSNAKANEDPTQASLLKKQYLKSYPKGRFKTAFEGQ